MHLTNWVHWHLLLTHIPLVAIPVIYISLLYFSITENHGAKKFSLVFLFLIGLMSIPVYLTGESAVDMLEDFPHITEKILTAHAEKALISFVLVEVIALLSIIAVFISSKKNILKYLSAAIYFIGLCTMISLYFTTITGGKIRHTEIRDINQDFPYPRFNNKFEP